MKTAEQKVAQSEQYEIYGKTVPAIAKHKQVMLRVHGKNYVGTVVKHCKSPNSNELLYEVKGPGVLTQTPLRNLEKMTK